MMKIGITGHQRLENMADWLWVDSAMKEQISKMDNSFIGITSLAIGADQLFAKIVLESGRKLWVILPFKGYESIFKNENDRNEYALLLSKAEKIEILDIEGKKEESYLAAGKRVADLSDLLLAVWDGNKAAGLGGTGDIVEYAQSKGKNVVHLNPFEKIVYIL